MLPTLVDKKNCARVAGAKNSPAIKIQQMLMLLCEHRGAQVAHFRALAPFAHKSLQSRKRSATGVIDNRAHAIFLRRGQVRHSGVDRCALIRVDAGGIARSSSLAFAPWLLMLAVVRPFFRPLRSGSMCINVRPWILHKLFPSSHFGSDSEEQNPMGRCPPPPGSQPQARFPELPVPLHF